MARQTTRAGETEMAADGLATYHEPTFRTYAPQWVTSENGTEALIQLCETYEHGQWEGFYATLRCRDARGTEYRGSAHTALIEGRQPAPKRQLRWSEKLRRWVPNYRKA